MNSIKENHYNFHNFDLTVSAKPIVLDAVHTRLHQFHTNQSNQPDMLFEYQCVKYFPERLKKAIENSRIVYEPPKGNIAYVGNEDKLTMNIDDKVGFICDYKKNKTIIYYTSSAEADSIWLLSHGTFSIAFNEKLKRRHCFPIHAAGMHINGKGLLIPGNSGAGKSTLTITLLRAGFGYLGDDTTFLMNEDKKLKMLAFPDEIDATEKSIQLFPELRGNSFPKHEGAPKYQIDPENVYADTLEYIWQCEPHILIFPKVADNNNSTISPISKDQALLELVPNVLLTEPRASQTHLDILAELVRKCDCYQLQTGRDFDVLAEKIKELLE